MNKLRTLALAAVAGACVATTAPPALAGVSINIGPAPDCPYGYYDYAPYACAPYGYYGPAWFLGGIFIGAGPWFHGPRHFRGHVNNHYDGRNGYRGPFPERGERPDPGRPIGRMDGFRGNEIRSGFGDHAGGGHVGGDHAGGGHGGGGHGGGGRR